MNYWRIMREIKAGIAIFASFAMFAGQVSADYLPKASEIRANSSVFSGNLSVSDDTVQKALATIDQMTISSEETDPVWTSEKTGYYTKTEIDSALYLQNESDPVWLSEKSGYYTATEIDNALYLQSESDPIYLASQASNITGTDITNLGNLSGVNTGDQDLSGYAVLSGDATFANLSADLISQGGTTLDAKYLRLDTSNDPLTGDLNFGDNIKIIQGADNDFSQYYDGTNQNFDLTIGNFVFSGGNVGIGTTAPTATLEVSGSTYPVLRGTRTTTSTTGVASGVDFLRKTTGDMADTFGGGMTFSIQDSAGVANYIGGIYAERNGADNKGNLLFYTNNGGVASPEWVPRVRIMNTGDVKLLADSQKLLFGAGDDAFIYYDATDMVINPKNVGAGNLHVLGSIDIDEDLYVTGTIYGASPVDFGDQINGTTMVMSGDVTANAFYGDGSNLTGVSGSNNWTLTGTTQLSPSTTVDVVDIETAWMKSQSVTIDYQVSGQGGNDSSTVLLLPLDGTDGATSTTDTSVGGSTHTITFSGDAQLDTDVKKFGTSSLLLDGAGDYLSIPDSEDFNYGSGDFEIDMWVDIDDPVTSDVEALVSHHVDNDNRIIFYIYQGTIRFLVKSGGATVLFFSSSASTLESGVHHTALVRYGNEFDIYWDGVSVANATSSATMPNISAPLLIGQVGGNQNYFAGHIDELRISKGDARWTTDFSASLPDAPYDTASSSGLPSVKFATNGTTNWTVGSDGSDSDTFKIASGSDLTTTTIFEATTAGTNTLGTLGIEANGNLGYLISDADTVCDNGTKIGEDNSVALCWYVP